MRLTKTSVVIITGIFGQETYYPNSLEMDVDEAQIRVLYIMGAGHSGSTVLDIILGNHPDILSVGELSNFVRRRAINGKYCACGKPANTCQFWSNIYWEWTHQIRTDDVEGYLALQNAFEHFRSWFHLQKQKDVVFNLLVFRHMLNARERCSRLSAL